MSRSFHPERDAAIVEMRQGGATLRATALAFGLGAERVRSIVITADRERKEREGHDVYSWLSVRTRNCFRNMGIDAENLEAICGATASDLLRFSNFGRRSLQEVEAYLASKGRTLRGKEVA